MKNICLYAAHQTHVTRWLENFVDYMKKVSNFTVILSYKEFTEQRTRFDHIFIWNGWCPMSENVRRYCEYTGIPRTFIEVGWFPQSRYYHLDSDGIGGESSLMFARLSEYVTDDQVCIIENQISENIIRRSDSMTDSIDSIVVPLQCENDVNITKFSIYRTMYDFVEYVKLSHPGQQIIVKPHPLHPDAKFDPTGVEVADAKADLKLLMWERAKLVVGINSTALYEAALLGIPYESYGEGPANRWKKYRPLLLAVMYDKQIPIEAEDISYWLNKYSEVEL